MSRKLSGIFAALVTMLASFLVTASPASAAGFPTTVVVTDSEYDAATRTGSISYQISTVNDGGDLTALMLDYNPNFAAGLRATSVEYSVDLYTSTVPPTTKNVSGAVDNFLVFDLNNVLIPAGATVTVYLTVHYSYGPEPLSEPSNALSARIYVGTLYTGTGTDVPLDAPFSAGHDPYGRFQKVAPNGEGMVWLEGYAVDPDTWGTPEQSTVVAFLVDGQWARVINTYAYGYHPAGQSGFGSSVSVTSAGEHQVCMYVYNEGPGTSQLADCETFTVVPNNPRGAINAVAQGDSINVTGWVVDDSKVYDSVGVWVVDNGQVVGQLMADEQSDYLLPWGVGGYHGLDYTYTPSSPGKHEVCVYGLNIGFGSSTWISCQTVTTTAIDHNPQGDMTVSRSGNGTVAINAWAFDADALIASLDTVIFVDGKIYGGFRASAPSPYLYPYGVPGQHGLGVNATVGAGTHSVCLYAHNAAGTPGSGKLLKCQTVTA